MRSKPDRLPYAESCRVLQDAGLLDAGTIPPLPQRPPRYDDEVSGVEFFRTQLADATLENDPEPINVDHYRVYLNLASSPRLGEMITAASTSYNESMQNYLQQHVHLVKEDRDADHWLPELPSSVRIVVERARSIK